MSPVVDDCPLPKRRSAAAGDKSSTRGKKKLTFFVAAGAAFGLATVGLGGFAVSHADHAAEGTTASASFDAGGLWQGSDANINSAEDLRSNQGAASRAKYRDPIEVSKCVPVDAPSDGARTFKKRNDINYPMMPGTFETTSQFSWRVSPISGEAMAHEGDDYAGADGTPFYAVADGKVISVTSNDHSGGMTVLEHHLPDGTRYETAYLHQWPETIPVSVGQEVKVGEQIGTVGSAGWSTGPHLHFEVHDANGTPIAPSEWMQAHDASYLGSECS